MNATAVEVMMVGVGGETWSEVAMGRSELVEEDQHMSFISRLGLSLFRLCA